MCCGGECSALRWLMQHAAVAVAPRCADGVNKFDIPFHEIDLPLPSILVFVPTNSSSCFHESCRSFPRIRILAFTDSVVPFHEFKLPLLRIQNPASTNPDIPSHEFNSSLPRIGSPDKPGGEIPQTKRKVIHLHHEHTRTFSIGAVDSAIRDTFKL